MLDQPVLDLHYIEASYGDTSAGGLDAMKWTTAEGAGDVPLDDGRTIVRHDAIDVTLEVRECSS